MSKESLDKKRDAIQVIKLALCVFPKYYTQFIINRFPESYANDPYAIDRIRNVWNLRTQDEGILRHIEILTEELK